jgi:hypothetical protein
MFKKFQLRNLVPPTQSETRLREMEEGGQLLSPCYLKVEIGRYNPLPTRGISIYLVARKF